MVRLTYAIALILMAALVPAQSAAATVSEVTRSIYSNQTVALLRLSGEIVSGDAKTMAEEIERLRQHPVSRIAVELEGPGGNYAEGLALARLFRTEQITTVVRNHALCLSACAIAFLGGARGYSGEARMLRLIEPRAKLGYHAPYLVLPKSNSHSHQDVADAFRVSIDLMNELAVLAERLHIHPRLLPQMMRPRSNDVFLITTVEHVALYGFELLLSGDSLEQAMVDGSVASLMRYTLTKSMAANLCMNAFAWRANSPLTLAREYDAGLTLGYVDQIGVALGTSPVLATVRPKDSRGTHPIALALPIGSAQGYSGHNFCNLEVRAQDPRQLRAAEVECRSFQSRSEFNDVEMRLRNGDFDGAPAQPCYIGYRYGPSMAQRNAEQSDGRRIGPWWLVPSATQLTQVEAVLSHYQAAEPSLDAVALSTPICKRATQGAVYC